MGLALIVKDWGVEATGSKWPEWLSWISHYGPWILAAGAVALLVRGLLRSGRYRIDEVLSEGAREELRAAIVEAESRTIGEIVPVVLGRSDTHPDARWRAAIFTVLVGSLLLVGLLPWKQPAGLLLAQVLLGMVGYLAARYLPDFGRVFVRPDRACEMAEEQAVQEFFQAGVMETEGRTGVLLFVSLYEHRVVVLADEGIAEKVDTQTWVETDQAVLEGIRAGSLKAGLLAGIERVGRVLAEHYPAPDGAPNELHDHLIVRES